MAAPTKEACLNVGDASSCDDGSTAMEAAQVVLDDKHTHKETPITEDRSERIDGNTDEGMSISTDESVSDPFYYMSRNEFTSEIFKIEILNLPRNIGFAEIKKRLLSLNLKPNKVKMPSRKGFAFVTFRSEEERQQALSAIEGHVWKSHTLKVKNAKPSEDPLFKKRKLQNDDDVASSKKSRDSEKKSDEEELSADIRLKKAVTPLWDRDYEVQLQIKGAAIKNVLRKLTQQLISQCFQLKEWVQSQRKKYDGMCCELLPVKSSPVREKYRNKCEFTIGKSEGNKVSVVGFRFDRYQGGCSVGEPTDLTFIPDQMKSVAQCFQEFVRSSWYDPFDPELHSGNWRQVLVRTTKGSDIMAVPEFHPQKLTENEIEEVKLSLKEYFMNGPGKECGITSMYFQVSSERVTGTGGDGTYQHLFGEMHIHEELLGIKFRISPNAFFQVNTVAAEVLYTEIAAWCNATSSTTVLDICCGTGSIGLTMAQKVKKVIGVDMSQQAVSDAKTNAEINGVVNTQYFCAKAEDIMPSIIKYVRSDDDLIAIVDPPRGGLHSKVIQTIRMCRSLNRLVYVSCNPVGAIPNFVDLLRIPSKRMKGQPFMLSRAQPVDLFPQTRHCEVLLLFEREPEPQNKPGGETQSNVKVADSASTMQTDKAETNMCPASQSNVTVEDCGSTSETDNTEPKEQSAEFQSNVQETLPSEQIGEMGPQQPGE